MIRKREIHNIKSFKKIKVFAVIALVVFSFGCSKDKKESKVSNNEVISEDSKQSKEQNGTTNNTDSNNNNGSNNSDNNSQESNNDSEGNSSLSNLPGVIKDQIFETELEGYGKITFVAIAPENKTGKNSDVQFKLYNQEKEICTLIGRNADYSLDSDEFIKVLAVSFTDYNNDGKNDILIINEYANTLDNKHYNDVRVYTQKSETKDFTRASLLEEYLIKNKYSDSISSVLSGIKDYKEYEESIDGSYSVEAQLELIANQRDTWLQDDEFAEGGYYYAVTDLDHNGRLEIIASNICGTGVYTYSNYYEVNETYDGIALCKYNFQEGDSQADIMMDSLDSFTDDSTGIEFYIFDDFIKNGAAEYYENKRAITLTDGEIKEIPLASKTTIYQSSTEYTMTCMDANQKEITEKQYDEIGDTVFSDLKKNLVTIGWYQTNDNKTIQNMNSEELVNMLSTSYKGFTKE